MITPTPLGLWTEGWTDGHSGTMAHTLTRHYMIRPQNGNILRTLPQKDNTIRTMRLRDRPALITLVLIKIQ